MRKKATGVAHLGDVLIDIKGSEHRLLPVGRHFIRTIADGDRKQHGSVLAASAGDLGVLARVEVLSWETGEPMAEVLFGQAQLMECEFFGDSTAHRFLELVGQIKADFLAARKKEVSA